MSFVSRLDIGDTVNKDIKYSRIYISLQTDWPWRIYQGNLFQHSGSAENQSTDTFE